MTKKSTTQFNIVAIGPNPEPLEVELKGPWLDKTHLGEIEVALLRHQEACEGMDPEKRARKMKEEPISREDLIRILEDNGQKPLSKRVRNYLCAILAGETRKPSGKKAVPKPLRERRDMLMVGEYRDLLGSLQATSDTDKVLDQYPEACNPKIREGTLAEVAAKVMAEKYLDGFHSWQSVHNIASSRKSRRKSVNERQR